MATQRSTNLAAQYNFDSWAEYLTINLAENIRQCARQQEKLKRLHIELDSETHSPARFKAILESDRVAVHPRISANANDGYTAIESTYQCATALANDKQTNQVSENFISQAQKEDSAFFADAWSLNMEGCIPHILMQFALRSMSRMMAQQLHFVGVNTTEDFQVQLHYKGDVIALAYDELLLSLKRQMGFYLTNLKVKKMACEICFRHKENKIWFMSLP